jgi:hypothetical protein
MYRCPAQVTQTFVTTQASSQKGNTCTVTQTTTLPSALNRGSPMLDLLVVVEGVQLLIFIALIDFHAPAIVSTNQPQKNRLISVSRPRFLEL